MFLFSPPGQHRNRLKCGFHANDAKLKFNLNANTKYSMKKWNGAILTTIKSIESFRNRALLQANHSFKIIL